MHLIYANSDIYDSEVKLDLMLEALSSCYGYEYQGDNLLVARINMLDSFSDHYNRIIRHRIDDDTLYTASRIISERIVQMDGMSFCTVADDAGKKSVHIPFNCRDVSFSELGNRLLSKRRFYAAASNPPYHMMSEYNKTLQISVYNKFMDSTYKISDRSVFITPARFLFDTGNTPSEWNKKMLNDKHLKIIRYYGMDETASSIFKNVNIQGGTAITYRNSLEYYDPIKKFTDYPILDGILEKINIGYLDDSIYKHIVPSPSYDMKSIFSYHKNLYNSLIQDMSGSEIETNAFTRVGEFRDIEEKGDMPVIGWTSSTGRCVKYINADLIDNSKCFDSCYVVAVPVAGDTKRLGKIISCPFIRNPHCCFTKSYMGLGAFDSIEYAEHMIKYVKSRFLRALIAVNMVTQHKIRQHFKNVPWQDFSDNSDIDWSKDVDDIDKQLYRKYKLSPQEIEFIEDNITRMD